MPVKSSDEATQFLFEETFKEPPVGRSAPPVKQAARVHAACATQANSAGDNEEATVWKDTAAGETAL